MLFTSIGEMRDMMAWQAIENGTAKQIYPHHMRYEDAIRMI